MEVITTKWEIIDCSTVIATISLIAGHLEIVFEETQLSGDDLEKITAIYKNIEKQVKEKDNNKRI